MPKPRLINAGKVFFSLLILVPAIILAIYALGRGNHRELYLNALISTGVLSFLFLAFTTTGLYSGWKLRDNLAGFRKKYSFGKNNPLRSWFPESPFIPEIEGDGILQFILFLIFSIIFIVFLVVILWFITEAVWLVIFLGGAAIYWAMYRMLRQVLRNALQCKDNFGRSFRRALGFTVVYSGWFYAAILLMHYLHH